VIFDTASIRFLCKGETECMRIHLYPYLTIFQAQICDASHRSRFPFCQIFVNLIDVVGYVVVSFVEQFTTTRSAVSVMRGSIKGNKPSALHIIEVITGILRLLAGFISFFFRLFELRLNVIKPFQKSQCPASLSKGSMPYRSIAFMFGAIRSISAVMLAISLSYLAFASPGSSDRSSSSIDSKSTSIP
jgi:hypothetical protein